MSPPFHYLETGWDLSLEESQHIAPDRSNRHRNLISDTMIRRGFSSKPQRDFFSDLRLRVAKALTDSLNPDDVRNELLGRHQTTTAARIFKAEAAIPPPEPIVSSLSIAETIAAIREEESRKFAAQWEREKDAIMAQAERAVRARLESDWVLQQRQMAFAKWKEGVESEQNQSVVTANEVDATAVANEPDFASEPHPILGRCIADLGYKRLHLISIEKLIHIPVWEKQRIYRHDRAIQMAKDKRKTFRLGLPGVMGIHENTISGELRILDGQHRIGMLAILLDKQQLHVNEDNALANTLQNKPIVVEVYPSAEPNAAKELFTEINRAEPVKLVDMPGVLNDSSRQILNDAAASLRDQYPAMFKSSQRCRPPHLNIDNLREALFVAAVLDRHAIPNATALLDWMKSANDRLKVEYQQEAVRNKVPEKVMEKADANQFYLGLDATWYTK
jgi:hypothetical protein